MNGVVVSPRLVGLFLLTVLLHVQCREGVAASPAGGRDSLTGCAAREEMGAPGCLGHPEGRIKANASKFHADALIPM